MRVLYENHDEERFLEIILTPDEIKKIIMIEPVTKDFVGIFNDEYPWNIFVRVDTE